MSGKPSASRTCGLVIKPHFTWSSLQRAPHFSQLSWSQVLLFGCPLQGVDPFHASLDFLKKPECRAWIIAGFIKILSAKGVCFTNLDGGSLCVCETFCTMTRSHIRNLVRDDGGQFRLAVCGNNDAGVEYTKPPGSDRAFTSSEFTILIVKGKLEFEFKTRF